FQCLHVVRHHSVEESRSVVAADQETAAIGKVQKPGAALQRPIFSLHVSGEGSKGGRDIPALEAGHLWRQRFYFTGQRAAWHDSFQAFTNCDRAGRPFETPIAYAILEWRYRPLQNRGFDTGLSLSRFPAVQRGSGRN